MLSDTAFHRQLSILAPDDAKTEIGIIGVGATGSATAMCLAKMGCPNIKLYDFDTIELHNIPNQFFSPDQVNMPKVKALSDNMEKFANIKPEIFQSRWENEVSPIMIIAVDSMADRKTIYESLKEKYGVELMIEPRMGAENFRIYSLTPSDPDHQKFYEKTLYTDEEAGESVCTNRAIAYNTFIMSGFISSIVKKFLKSEPISKEIIFDLKNMTMFTT